jgi:beta-glucanase (GH16 family)
MTSRKIAISRFLGLLAAIGLPFGHPAAETIASPWSVGTRHASASFDPNDPAASGLVLTFDDEFSGASISSNNVVDRTLWTNHGINPGSPSGIETPVPEALSVHDGVLEIMAWRDRAGWKSGLISTVNSSLQGFTQKYGYFEARLRIPSGKGAWPAFWLLSARHFTDGAPAAELDVMENAGGKPTAWAGTIHDGFGGKNRNNVQNAGVDLSRDFHRFGLLWPPRDNSVTWYLDGRPVMRAPKFGTTDLSPMLIILNLQIGDFGAGGPDASTPNPMRMYVDYVRVWQFAEENPVAVGMQPVSPPSF